MALTQFRRSSVHISLLAGFLCLATAVTFAATPAAPPKKDEPNVSAPHAILVEAESGSVLFERGADDLVFPASLAKLMTAEYVFNELKQGRIKPTDEYPVSENAWRKGGAPSGGSTMFAALHSKIPVEDLIKALIIQSANDACIVFAEALAGNEPAFADLLTKRARELGMSRSVFTNSNGLPDPDMLILPPDHALAAHPGPIDIGLLVDEPMIMNELSIGYGEIVGNMFSDLGLRPRIKAVVDNVETIKVMVQTGLGIALIPAGAADIEAQSGLLAVRATVPSRSISIHVYRAARSLSRRKELLLTHLLEGRSTQG